MSKFNILAVAIALACASQVAAQTPTKPLPYPPGPAYLHSAPRPIDPDMADMMKLDSINLSIAEETAKAWRYARENRTNPSDYLLIIEWDNTTQAWRERYVLKKAFAPKADTNARNAAEKAARDKGLNPCH